MSLVLVTGGTGHLGRDIVRTLVSQGRALRLLAKSTGDDTTVEWARGNLATGEGIADAVRGVDTVVHAATLSPIARRGSISLPDFFSSPSAVDVDGTRRLLQVSKAANVEHFVFVSIVGLEKSSLPYARVKLAGELLVRESSLPWSVVRATPFFYLMANMLKGLRRLPIWPLPTAPCNPVDTSDVADYVAACLDDGKRGMRDEIGGPDLMSFADFGREFQGAAGFYRPILPVPLSEKMAFKLGFVRTKGGRSQRGKKMWAEWLNSEGRSTT